MRLLTLLLCSLFAYEPPGTEPIQIRFDQKDLSPQNVPLKMDLQGITLKEDVNLDIHLTKAKGEVWVKDVTYKNCDGLKVGQKGVISILCQPAHNDPARERRIDIELAFGAASPDKPQLSIATFGYYTTLTPGKKPQAKRVRMNLNSFWNGYMKTVTKERGRQLDFNVNWKKYQNEDRKMVYEAIRAISRREDLTNAEKNELRDRLNVAFTAKYEDMPEAGRLPLQQLDTHLHWCKEYEASIRSVQTAPRIYYEAYTIGSAGKTVIGRTGIEKSN